MQVDIYVREKNGSREIRFPILPEKINCPTGDTTFVTYEIMNRGEVAVPTGAGLDGASWESEFPGVGQQNDPSIRGTWADPKTYDSIIKDWKRNGEELELLVIGYPINMDVYVKEYKPVLSGAFGGITYEIAFLEARDITIKTTKVEQTSTKRPATKSKSYTIKKGDTLWDISHKYYGAGSKWRTIYNANKDIIEKTAKKYGRKSSSNGHWIYPGTKITIP